MAAQVVMTLFLWREGPWAKRARQVESYSQEISEAVGLLMVALAVAVALQEWCLE